MTLADAAGKIIYRQSGTYEAGVSDIEMDMRNVPAQVYILRIATDNDEILATEKVLKRW